VNHEQYSTAERRAAGISKDLCDQLNDKFKTSRSALEVNEATDVWKVEHLLTYIRFVA
jgi:hypothetical protein